MLMPVKVISIFCEPFSEEFHMVDLNKYHVFYLLLASIFQTKMTKKSMLTCV